MQVSAPISDGELSRDDGRTEIIPAGTGGTFVVITGLFFLWGMPNNLNDVLIRQFMKSFALSRFEAGLIQSAFYLGYFVLALPAGLLMRRFGYKAGFLTGLLLFATGCFLFYPAASLNRYGFFLAALFVAASGLAFLETAANPFIAQLGSPVTAATRLNLAQAFNPIGSIVGVLLGTRYILSGTELNKSQIMTLQMKGIYAAYLQAETRRVVMPYMALGIICLIWAVAIAKMRFPKVVQIEDAEARTSENWELLFQSKGFLFSLLAQFLYVGAQVGTWSFFIQYAQDNTGLRERTAALLLVSTLIAFSLGRFVSAALMRRLSSSRLMFLYALVNIILLCVALTEQNWTGLISILFTSFFMSMMYPTIFALGIGKAGPNTKLAGSLLVMMIIGGAIITPIMRLIAESNIAQAYWVPLIAYAGVAVFARYCGREGCPLQIKQKPKNAI